MPLNIKYIPIYSLDVNAEVEFFIRYFDLIHAGKIRLATNLNGVLLKLDIDRELYLLIIPSEWAAGHSESAIDFKIIIHTADCLKEYLFMKEGGIEFEERPQHLPIGLAAKFKISEGNLYMLLEERNYDQLFT